MPRSCTSRCIVLSNGWEGSSPQPLTAIALIITFTPRGISFTQSVSRAGGSPVKQAWYTRLISA